MTMTSAEIRQGFLDFFAGKGHTIVPSASLVPEDDPTLLFTNAGMNQFKNIFLGLEKRAYTRAADTQKCMRVSGKHNDLDDVGRDTYHHTFFEMMGNWSFGDYYKKEAIAWAWELLTEIWGLPAERLWATVFKDDQGELEPDEEAERWWRETTGINPRQILFFGRKDNFWEMGDTGPCGPCSEVHYDRGPEYCDKRDVSNHVCQVNGDCGRFIELWNLVFIQYNCDETGHLNPLPAQHVDTGAGFERLVSILQGVDSNYETDLFSPVLDRIQELVGHSDAERAENIVAYRVIADHGRAITFLVGDGVLPGNEGRKYVLRMILRRAARFGRKIGFQEPFLAEIAKVVIEIMGSHFTELPARQKFILETITQEEKRFYHTLDAGLALLDEIIDELSATGETVIPGDKAFTLWSERGFPLDLTKDIAEEHRLTVEEDGYWQAMKKHRLISGAGQRFEAQDESEMEVYSVLLEDLQQKGKLPPPGVLHVYDDNVDLDTEVVALLKNEKVVTGAKIGDEVEMVLAGTPFYVESGGQVCDTGFVAHYHGDETEPRWEVEVREVYRPLPGLIVHRGQVMSGSPRVGDKVWALVDYERRLDIARNHTATHLLHSELRYILGEHVQQAGSLVAPDRLRFDFTHSAMLTQDELDAVERSVNDAILANYPLEALHTDYHSAVDGGALALFGEKYGEQVRVIKVGVPGEPFSQELCGGTHVHRTGEVGLFRILSESSVGAGVRRVEAVTGRAAQRLAQERLNVLDAAATYLSCNPDEVDRKVLGLMGELQSREKEIERLQRKIAQHDFETLLTQVRDVDGVRVLAAKVEAASIETLREMSDWFRNRMGSGVIVLGAVMGGKPNFVAAITADLIQRGLHAGQLVKAVAQVVGGGGGGKPTLAQAGGRDVSRMGEALNLVPDLVAEAVGEDLRPESK
ncbi:MAG: alanine--tRNA ligase [Chloroflexota bacterium]|nr:alanine--tRNA ligase [Chloroflexota bacterium]